MSHCTKIDIYTRACIDIYKKVTQGVQQPYTIMYKEIAPEYTVTLYNRNKTVAKTYTLVPIANTLLWIAPKEDFVTSEMTYTILPTVQTPENFIQINGKIFTTL